MKGPITAKAWNALLDVLAPMLRNRVLNVTSIGGGMWLHPWHTKASWNGAKKKWEAVIKPGFVFNGRTCDVTVSIVNDDGEAKDVPLLDAPMIPLTSFRAIGTDAVSIDGSGEAVHEYFRYHGVGEPISFSTEGEEGIVEQVSGLAEDQTSKRLLRACEILLYHDRPAASADWTQGVGIDGSFAQFAIVYNTSGSARNGAYIRTAKAKPLTSDEDPASAAALGQRFADQAFDWLPLVTVYLLSPENAGFDSAPDETWTPHIQHHLFWNLHYGHTPVPPAANQQNLTLNTAGLGGSAVNLQATVNQMLAQSNDAMAALNELLRNRVKGRFWTL